MSTIYFLEPGPSEAVKRVIREDIDINDQSLTFGIIQVDKDGRVVAYSDYESQLSGRPVTSVVGKLFFGEVAPCTKSDEFYGRFVAGADSGDLNVHLEYEFGFKGGDAHVQVYMTSAKEPNRFWIFVRPKESAEQ